MKHLFVLFFAALCWVSCQDTPKQAADSTAPDASKPNPNAIPHADKKPDAALPANADVAPEGSALVGVQSATINGTNVTMRKEATIKSEKIGSFENNEKVAVLETKNVQNEGEAILTKAISLKGDGGTVNLPKGKAVMIETYKQGENTYQVSYEDPKKGKLTAQIDASIVETIIYASWFKVKRPNGETGWVLGKFLK